jgi:hypothetical protein
MDQAGKSETSPYLRLAIMAGLSFVAMYILMYAMVDRASNVHPGLDQAYMAGLMTAPMVVIELLLMGGMYPRRGTNLALVAASVVLGLACFAAIRQQALIGDREFVRAMIPHHSGAILMCRKATITDPELRQLCARIIAGQQAEIDQMQAMLDRPGFGARR